jgi:prepilin peptidase CpaA
VLDVSIIVITSLSVFFDVKERRIPNWLILLGLILAFGLNGSRGLANIYYSLIGFVLGIGVFIIPFALGWMGAGDVKYVGVIGALLGPGLLPRIIWYSVVAAGLMALVVFVIAHLRFDFIRAAWADFKLAFLTFGRVLPDSINARVANGAHTVPWGVAFGAGTIVAYYIDSTGRWSGF